MNPLPAAVCGLIALIACIWALLYIGVPLWAWVLASGLATLVLALETGASVACLALGACFGVLLLLSLVPLRRALLTGPLFAAFRRVLPPMSRTEREAIEAGEPWWEAEMFRGRPDWRRLLEFEYTALTAEEQSFLDNEVETACRMTSDWKTEFEDRDLPPEVWTYLREQRFFSMLIPKEFGGLGFSYNAQSMIVTKLATRSIALAVTVMVPNSLGPGELLLHYGTDEQKRRWLPALADGREIPCFGLTGPEAGSDAAAMPDTGLVCWGEHEGARVLGLRLNFSKRWITLAPVATVIGLAFKLRDPEGLLKPLALPDAPEDGEYGITCALVPASHPGVQIGRRHYPGSSFMNGPIFGQNVFIPLDWIIGGPAMAGQGWRMLVECLSAGRGISLPALATAAGLVAYRITGAYTRVRWQFNVAIGKFEGVQEASSRIAGLAYTLDAMRELTASAVDHCTPSVVTALAKYHMTEMMRRVLIDAMDIFAGRGVQQGPRNPLASAYRAAPIAITVEGANILTRNLMIFGQGGIRCHAHILKEMQAAQRNDLPAFDRLLMQHIGNAGNRAVRAFTLGLTGARLARAPVAGHAAHWFRQLERMSAALAITADVVMGVLGGELKRRERLSARLGDVLSQLYIGSALLRRFVGAGQPADERVTLDWAMAHCLHQVGEAFDGLFRNLPVPLLGRLLRMLVFPLGNPYPPVSDAACARAARAMMEPQGLRERFGALVFRSQEADDPLGRIERAYSLLLPVEAAFARFHQAAAKGRLNGSTFAERLNEAVATGLIQAGEAEQIAQYDRARYDALLTDDFSKEYMQATRFGAS